MYVHYAGSFYIFSAESNAELEVVRAHFPTRVNDELLVEHRYVACVVEGLAEHGVTSLYRASDGLPLVYRNGFVMLHGDSADDTHVFVTVGDTKIALERSQVESAEFPAGSIVKVKAAKVSTYERLVDDAKTLDNLTVDTRDGKTLFVHNAAGQKLMVKVSHVDPA